MALLVISRHAMAFLLGWEVMALSAFFLVTTEDHRDECRRAGWIYLIATHVGTLTLFAHVRPVAMGDGLLRLDAGRRRRDRPGRR